MATYDYIIVGAGSAGCVVANRLSADPDRRVLILEAGGLDNLPLMAIPMACGRMMFNPKVDWGFATEPEPFADNRVVAAGAGKVLGGGSSVNGMVYTRGHPRDYDQWAQMGARGWSYREVLPYFKRSEASWRGTSEYHGSDGPLTVSPLPTDSLYAPLAETARRRRYGVREDLEGGSPEGLGAPDFTIHKGRRGSTARRFLRPVLSRPNLTLIRRAHTTRILFEGKSAVGVEYLKDGMCRQVRAEREVIVSAGVFNSPKLLMLSGIGQTDQLAAVGVTPFHELPGVGQNLQDHATVDIVFASTEPPPFDNQLRLDNLLRLTLQWRLTGRGPLASVPVSAMAFWSSREGLDRPDLELSIMPAIYQAQIWFPGWRKPNGGVLNTHTILLRPDSRGWVRLRSADSLDPPRIQFNLLREATDRQALLRGLRMVRDFMATPPASELVRNELRPGAALITDEDLETYIRQTVATSIHATSTCSMGIGADAVVDADLKVHGLDKLRVIDASIMPTVVGGHTNAASIMIGEKGADLVLGRSAEPAPAGSLELVGSD